MMSNVAPGRITEMSVVGSGSLRRNRGASRTFSSPPTPRAAIDRYAIIPILACVFALIVDPLTMFFTNTEVLQRGVEAAEGRPGPRFFWPVVAALSILLAVKNHSRLRLPPHLIWLFAYLVFAGASVFWAFSPGHSFIRYLQQTMIVTSIVFPALLAGKTTDILRALFLCFALSILISLFFVLRGSSTIVSYGTRLVDIGYEGYFNGKNYLGECAAVSLILSIHEIRQHGWRRVFGVGIAAIAVLLVYLSDSKTALGLALICPMLAALTLLVRRVTGISVALILLTIPVFWILLSILAHVSLFSRLSYMLYNDSSLTGRTIIWEFAESKIDIRPLVGWGYQSFWLVPNSPSLGAPGWVKMMPNAHNGYYDTILETGYIGLALLLAFVIATLHAVGRVADRDRSRAQLLLSLALFIILYNFFESLWVRGFEFLWVVFVIVAAEIGRYWGPFRAARPVHAPRAQNLAGSDPLPRARLLRLPSGPKLSGRPT